LREAIAVAQELTLGIGFSLAFRGLNRKLFTKPVVGQVAKKSSGVCAPASADFQFGWWYVGAGQQFTGSADMFLGVTERNVLPPSIVQCPPGPYQYGPGRLDNQCDMFHFWSLHSGGANFVFADAHVQFIAYSAAKVMPALATRAARDNLGLDDY